MANLTEMLREVMTLTANVTRLDGDVKDLLARLRSVEDKVTKVEAREDFVIEKAKNAAMEQTNAAMREVQANVFDMKHQFSMQQIGNLSLDGLRLPPGSKPDDLES
jgi:hypothetical protein